MRSSFFLGIGVGILMSVTLVGVSVRAADGGLFGQILGKILGIPAVDVLTYSGDGTVANARNLGGVPASQYQVVAPSQSCGAGMCVYGFDPSGNILCR